MLALAAPVFLFVLLHLVSIAVLYAQPTFPELIIVGDDGSPASAFPLGVCQGVCESEADVRTRLLPRCQ